MIKKEVLILLSTTDDIAVIEEVYAVLPDTKTINDIAINELTLPLQIKIGNAIEDYKTRNYITLEEMKHKL
jgi:hypothetical protein